MGGDGLRPGRGTEERGEGVDLEVRLRVADSRGGGGVEEESAFGQVVKCKVFVMGRDCQVYIFPIVFELEFSYDDFCRPSVAICSEIALQVYMYKQAQQAHQACVKPVESPHIHNALW